MRVFAHKSALLAVLMAISVPALARPHHPAASRQKETRTTHTSRKTEAQHLHHRHGTPPPPSRSINSVSSRRHRQTPPARSIAHVNPSDTRSSEPILTRHNRKLHRVPAPEVSIIKAPPVLMLLPPMKGSHEILIHQNVMAASDGLTRIADDDDLELMRTTRLLLPIPITPGLQADDRLPANRRFCRPWTAQFLAAMARAHYARFHSNLQVNSAVRTVEFQQKLLRTNGNAAPAEGDTASPHLTGQAVDIAKHGLTVTQIAWVRGYLLPLVQQGKIDVEEEFQQACFHISVYRRYVPQPDVPRDIAPAPRNSTRALATVLR